MDAATTIRCAQGVRLTATPFLVAGIVNVTPDSFSDGGLFADAPEAVAHCAKLLAEGADILDIGGASTRPGAPEVPEDQELARVLPVVRGAVALCAEAVSRDPGCQAVVSVDTYCAEVARQCLEAGAGMINDISGARYDPALLEVLAAYRPGYVLMHAQGTPRTMQQNPHYDDVVDEVRAFFAERLEVLARAGLPEEHVALDPGIGFGKTLEHNLDLMRRLDRLAEFGRPVYVGISRKSWLHKLLGLELAERAIHTEVATALLAERGARVHRVHDVAACRRTLRMVEAMRPGATR